MAYKRLEAIVSLINRDERVLDVGTDHGIVPILLLERGITMNVTASDIADGPINIAKQNIKNAGFEDQIKVIKSNGLKDVDRHSYDTIIIAGMGGKLISNIIKKSFKGKYIIHATNNHKNVRNELMHQRFLITDEFIIEERGVKNIIIVAQKTGFRKSRLNKFNQVVGPVLRKRPGAVIDEYYREQLLHNIDIYEKSKNKKYLKLYNHYGRAIEWRNKNLKNS